MAARAGLRAAVLGSPVAHSLSPALHRAAYAALGLDWSYEAVQVGETELAGFVDGLDGTWAGLSLTMPLKRAVLPLLWSASPLVEAVGACNTLLLPSRAGHNTDVQGLVGALAAGGVGTPSGRAAVLGGGATAASAVAALAAVGWREVAVHVRSPARAADVVAVGERVGCRVAVPLLHEPWWTASVVVSTLPASASSSVASLVPVGAGGGLLLDVVYDPWPTPLARAWSGTVVGGFEMLLHQAVEQVRLMTGSPVGGEVVAAMRVAGEHELASRGQGGRDAVR